MSATLFTTVEDVAAVLAQHHVWPHYTRKEKRRYWRCTCGVEWDVQHHPRWQPVEDEHQAREVCDVFGLGGSSESRTPSGSRAASVDGGAGTSHGADSYPTGAR